MTVNPLWLTWTPNILLTLDYIFMVTIFSKLRKNQKNGHSRYHFLPRVRFFSYQWSIRKVAGHCYSNTQTGYYPTRSDKDHNDFEQRVLNSEYRLENFISNKIMTRKIVITWHLLLLNRRCRSFIFIVRQKLNDSCDLLWSGGSILNCNL